MKIITIISIIVIKNLTLISFAVILGKIRSNYVNGSNAAQLALNSWKLEN